MGQPADADEIGRIGEITVVREHAHAVLMRILAQMSMRSVLKPEARRPMPCASEPLASSSSAR